LEELGPFENIADANGEFKGSPRFKRDLEWTENGTHRINQYSKNAFPLSNDIPAKIFHNVFQNDTHRINFMTNEVKNVATSNSATSSLPTGYQIIKWYYEGMTKTDTFKQLTNPITNPVYNSSITYTAPNYTLLERHMSPTQNAPNKNMTKWIFNGTHLFEQFSSMNYKIQDPNTGVLVSSWYQNASHQIDFVKNKIYAFAPSNNPSFRNKQIVTWSFSSNGFIKTDSLIGLKKPLNPVAFNLSEIYFGGYNHSYIYINESYPQIREWSYNGTHLINVRNAKIYSVPSPVEAVIVNNVFYNITHKTNFVTNVTFQLYNSIREGRFYQEISWLFNGMTRVDTFRDLQEPINNPVFDLKNIYFEDPNSTNFIIPPISFPPEQEAYLVGKEAPPSKLERKKALNNK
jgi:hypothetical protein